MSVSTVAFQVRSISNRIYTDLKKQIIAGTLQPGARLIVLDICGQYQVSQAPVREALERLKQEGLIVGKTNKGSIVANVTDKEIRDLFALREMIEAYAVRQAIGILDEVDFARLEQILAEMDEAIAENDDLKIVEKDMEFHGYFFIKCDNGAILDSWNQMKSKIMRFMAISNRYYSTEGLVAWHKVLIDALRTGNAAEAEQHFVEHMHAYKLIPIG